VPIADSYNTYRGSIDGGGFGADHTCFEIGDSALNGATTSTDSDTPLPGEGHYYLVGTVDSCGESSLGRSTAGLERIPAATCP